MGYGKRSRFIKITTIVTALVFGSTLLLGIASPFLNNKDKTTREETVSDEKVWLPQEKEISSEELEKAGDAAKYMTISQKGNIDIIVNYLSPVNGAKDALIFEVTLGTHSIDLSKYRDIGKYVELRTDTGTVVSEGFEWDVESAESHHIRGMLKIKNNINGSAIAGADTKSFGLVFRNIPDASEREHLYEGDKLK